MGGLWRVHWLVEGRCTWPELGHSPLELQALVGMGLLADHSTVEAEQEEPWQDQVEGRPGSEEDRLGCSLQQVAGQSIVRGQRPLLGEVGLQDSCLGCSPDDRQVPAVQELHTEDMGRWGQRQEECGQYVG